MDQQVVVNAAQAVVLGSSSWRLVVSRVTLLESTVGGLLQNMEQLEVEVIRLRQAQKGRAQVEKELAAKVKGLQQGLDSIMECMRKQQRVRQIGSWVKCALSVIDAVPMFGTSLASPLRAVVTALDACASHKAVKELDSKLGLPSHISESVQQVIDEEEAAGVYKKGVDLGCEKLQERLFTKAYLCWKANQSKVGGGETSLVEVQEQVVGLYTIKAMCRVVVEGNTEELPGQGGSYAVGY